MKKNKCPECGAEQPPKFPLYKKDPETGEKKFQWKNLFKMDLMSALFLIVIIGMTISYNIDTENCRQVLENPVRYCTESNACCVWAKTVNQTKINSCQYGRNVKEVNFNASFG